MSSSFSVKTTSQTNLDDLKLPISRIGALYFPEKLFSSTQSDEQNSELPKFRPPPLNIDAAMKPFVKQENTQLTTPAQRNSDSQLVGHAPKAISLFSSEFNDDPSKLELGVQMPPKQRKRLLANVIEPSLRAVLFKLCPNNSPIMREPQMRERKKERNMNEIIHMVVQWIRLQDGAMELLADGTTQFIELNPEEAAAFVGMTKRSLQHYTLEIRHSFRFGFNFEAHRESPVSSMRRFLQLKQLQEYASMHVDCDDLNIQPVKRQRVN